MGRTNEELEAENARLWEILGTIQQTIVTPWKGGYRTESYEAQRNMAVGTAAVLQTLLGYGRPGQAFADEMQGNVTKILRDSAADRAAELARAGQPISEADIA